MPQYGFYFDQSRCSGCQTCTIACKNVNGLPPGPLKYLKVYEYEKGSFPDVRVHMQWIPCYHCEKPSCVTDCPTKAISKEPKFGAVLIDDDKCDGCRICYESCPYGAPVFESDEAGVKARKCDMCVDRLNVGEQPVCVLSCPMRALDFGDLNQCVAKYKGQRDLEDLPSSETTKPAVIFKPYTARKQLVPYNSEKALKLLMRRGSLPVVFNSVAEVTDIPEGIVGRDRLVIKPKSAEELMRRSRNDEG
ncbi:MAG: 4Fe-4S dicluster domain-containing protein [Dehalococcoidia bacterium]|nr:4Fe-4S dicluster domain-containing protein [Dehalococcoidia bacterium]